MGTPHPTEGQITATLFLIALLSGAAWMVGEHAAGWLGVEVTALTKHRGTIGLVFLLSVVALLTDLFASDARGRDKPPIEPGYIEPGKTIVSRRYRDAWVGSALVLASVLATAVGAELALRMLASVPNRWDLRNFLTNPAVTEGRWRALQHDELLGYVPRPGYSGTDHGRRPMLSFDEHGLRAHRRNEPPPRHQSPPILVVGASYAMGEDVADDQTFPAHLQGILQRRVLNAGVLGYGLDQMVLRAERLVPVFRPDLLVVSFIADDVHRTEMRILWGRPVPYFDIVEGSLVLRNVPVPPPTEATKPLDPLRRVLGYSLLADVAMRRLDLDAYWLRGQPDHAEAAHDEGDRVSCLLMDRLWQLGAVHRARVLVVAQYTPAAWTRHSTLQLEQKITAEVLDCARSVGLQTLDTLGAVGSAVRSGRIERYYTDQHMNDAGNRLTATLIARHLREQGLAN